MADIVNLDVHRPHICIRVANGNVHVIPKSFFEDVRDGKRRLSDMDCADEITAALVGDWLETLS